MEYIRMLCPLKSACFKGNSEAYITKLKRLLEPENRSYKIWFRASTKASTEAVTISVEAEKP